MTIRSGGFLFQYYSPPEIIGMGLSCLERISEKVKRFRTGRLSEQS
ncbi:hypothetical protein CES86_4534 [Brucella lupini]|uniref:Uncharacterized protein n=1 Tax=Brucella lupini TaxID=255457 RepID=A0A256GBC9_9HYPH|nr:hypothetical protein CES86_4534 [Brucella lupini]